MDKKQIGQLGEDIAVKYLIKKKYKILERNFSYKVRSLNLGEIDIIAKKGKTIVFVEVKTKTSNEQISPEDKINLKKLKTIQDVGQIWLQKNKISPDTPWQIDIVSIVLDLQKRIAKVTHFENA
ncbi:YraN family protein [bacterium]|nr:YraN family protein [bacterium]